MKKALAVALPVILFWAILYIYSRSVYDPIQIRRYDNASIFAGSWKTTEQEELYRAYKAAPEKRSPEVFENAFEALGVSFPNGTGAIINPIDTHLYIRHRESILNQLEDRFSLSGTPYKAPNKALELLKNALRKMGLFNDDPFAQKLKPTGHNQTVFLQS